MTDQEKELFVKMWDAASEALTDQERARTSGLAMVRMIRACVDVALSPDASDQQTNEPEHDEDHGYVPKHFGDKAQQSEDRG